MQTNQLVQASATVISVVTLRRGDIYKRLEPKTTYQSEKLVFGQVTDVLHNGEAATITAIEFDSGYSSAKPTLKVFAAENDLLIYPAETAEFLDALQDAVTAQQKVLEAKAREIETEERIFRSLATIREASITEAESVLAIHEAQAV